MCEISFEYDFLLFIYDNIFAHVEYWEMISYVINNDPINTRHFNAMLLVKILSINVADEEVTRIGLVISGQKLLENKYRLKRKEKNESREEIFYQMKVFFVKISCRKCFL